MTQHTEPEHICDAIDLVRKRTANSNDAEYIKQQYEELTNLMLIRVIEWQGLSWKLQREIRTLETELKK